MHVHTENKRWGADLWEGVYFSNLQQFKSVWQLLRERAFEPDYCVSHPDASLLFLLPFFSGAFLYISFCTLSLFLVLLHLIFSPRFHHLATPRETVVAADDSGEYVCVCVSEEEVIQGIIGILPHPPA